MSLRTPAIENAYDYVPNEAGALGHQRYGAEPWAGQYGIVALFPDGPQPWGGDQGAALAAARTSVPAHHADGAQGTYPNEAWTLNNPSSWIWSNWGYYDTSPWGAALRFVQTSIGNADRGCSHGAMLSHAYSDSSEFTVFAIVKNFSASATARHFFTLHGGQSTSFAFLPASEEFSLIATGTAPSTTLWAITDYLRADGWMLFAFQFHSPSGGGASKMDAWVNGHLIVADHPVVWASLSTITKVTVASDATNKDGLSWDGIIAQVALLTSGSAPASDDLLRDWFDDPWWFLKAERVMPQLPGCPCADQSISPATYADASISPATTADQSISPATRADASLEPATSADASVSSATHADASVCPKG